LASALTIAAAVVSCFTVAAPWAPLAAATAYVVVIGGALVVAAAYSDRGPLFGGVRGIREIVENISTARS
jgi:hypothetical protein